MKKIYKTPVTMTVRVKMRHHLLGSSKINVGGSYNGSAEIQSRRDSYWDDEDGE